MRNCPCGSGKTYATCCGLFIEGEQLAATAEQLMRSRYTAYTDANIDYILQTMRSPAADDFNAESSREWAKTAKWLKLEVLQTSCQGDKAYVEFKAYFSLDNKTHIMYELSEFHLINGKWFYVDGEMPKPKPVTRQHHVGRNDPCICGSGKKYKKCCGL